MKIVNIIGGLGNQMFQYAFALSLGKKQEDSDVSIDTSHYHYLFFKKYKGANMHNGYEVERVFPQASLPHAKWWQLLKVTWFCPNFLLSRAIRRLLPVRKTEWVQPVSRYFSYCPEVYDVKGDVYFEGQWSSVSFYTDLRDDLLHVFAHPEAVGRNAEYISEMHKTESVGIHIRRGDYLQDPSFRGICEIDYYIRAINEIEKDGDKHHFYIFSNDTLWCKENIKPLLKKQSGTFVTENQGLNSCWDMHLMTHCKDLIIANSSFSWWAAFLNNRGGRIVAPQKWVNRTVDFDIWDKSWIIL